MNLSQNRSGLVRPRTLLLGLSLVSLAICALSAAAQYRKSSWWNVWQPIGWLLSMLFLLCAFLPSPYDLAVRSKSLIKPRTAFFLFWILFFVVSHLWNFRTAPWNGNGLFDDSAVDLLYLKNYVIGHPFQPAWFHEKPYPLFISRETLFHYYVWAFFYLFGYNILSYEAALLLLWSAAFVFTLLLTDLLFQSYVVTSIVAVIFNFLPFAFLYTFVGYRYPLTILLCLASLYFLHLGFRTASSLALLLGGIAAGLCLASSIIGKQFMIALALWVILYASLHWKRLKRGIKWTSVLLVAYGVVVAATPILCYIVFNREHYTYYEGTFIRSFWQALHRQRSPNDLSFYVNQLRSLFFGVPGPRLFFPNFLPIPLPYYFFLVPGLILAICESRYELVLLATLPVVGIFISGGGTVEHRMLLAIPFWIMLMGSACAGLLRLKLPAGLKIILLGVSASILACGLVPSIQYIYAKTKNPFGISYFEQDQVAVSRFLRDIVAGKKPSNPPVLERDEFNRAEGTRDVAYDTLICPREAWSVIHLFLHDYDDMRILSLCGGTPMYVMTQQEVWRCNKKSIVDYVPKGKDLKLIWESDPRTLRILQQVRAVGADLAMKESISFSFYGRSKAFYVLNIASKNIRELQKRIATLPDSTP